MLAKKLFLLLVIYRYRIGVCMIKSVSLAQMNVKFSSKNDSNKIKKDGEIIVVPDEPKAETKILSNDIVSNAKQSFHKNTNAFLFYPIKGLRGDVNSDFYEFLAMGAVPYVMGSAMFMFVFNCVTSSLKEHSAKFASKAGKKLGLGVIFYALGKNLSKGLVTKPVKAATGVDTEMPYQNVLNPLPKYAGEAADLMPMIQQRKVFDSKEFYRKDLLYKEDGYYDKVAKKLGLGKNLNDAESEASPIIQNIVATSNTAKSLSSYCWAGLGVALAAQDSWSNFFDSITNAKSYQAKPNESVVGKIGGHVKTFGENLIHSTKMFGSSFKKACETLWTGAEKDEGSLFRKHAGKGFILSTVALTAFLTANVILRAKNMARNTNEHTIDKKKESVVI